MRALPITRPERHGAFTSAEATQLGWSRSTLARAAESGRLCRLARGVYAPTLAGDGPRERRDRLRAASVAAVLGCPSSASHLSSAVLANLPTWSIPELPCITVQRRRTGDATCAHLHRARLTAADVMAHGDVTRTRTPRTICDIAREHGLFDAVVVGDAALHRRMLTSDDLLRAAARCAGWPGSRRMRAALAQLDGRSESPLESASRLRIRQLGLPAPELQPQILTASGIWLARVDFFWPEWGVVGEVDGAEKYAEDGKSAFLDEKGRQELVEDTGLVVVRWGNRAVNRPVLLQDKLLTARRRAEARGAAGGSWQMIPMSPPGHRSLGPA